MIFSLFFTILTNIIKNPYKSFKIPFIYNTNFPSPFFPLIFRRIVTYYITASSCANIGFQWISLKGFSRIVLLKGINNKDDDDKVSMTKDEFWRLVIHQRWISQVIRNASTAAATATPNKPTGRGVPVRTRRTSVWLSRKGTHELF